MPSTLEAFQTKAHKIIQQLANKQIRRAERVQVATLVTDPTLRYVLGPSAITPLEEGDDLASDPNAVLAWFADVRLDAGKALVRDVIVPTEARNKIGEVGSPVEVYKDPTTGAYMIVGRSDRVTEFQSVKSYTTQDLGLGFIRGHLVVGQSVFSAFYPYTQASGAILAAGQAGSGLHRGSAGSGTPVTSFTLGQSLSKVPFGELAFGVDPLGVLYLTTYNRDGTTTQVKQSP